MDRYFEARRIQQQALQLPLEAPSEDSGEQYFNFVKNAVLADNWFLARAYLRVIAQRPWWINNQPDWRIGTADDAETASHIVDERVDEAVDGLQRMMRFNRLDYSVQWAIGTVVEPPAYWRDKNKWITATQARQINNDRRRIAAEEHNEDAAHFAEQWHADDIERQRVRMEQSEDENDAF